MTPANLKQTLEQIQHGSYEDLKALWAKHMTTPRPSSAVLMRYFLAWHAQARVHGGLSVGTKRRIQMLMKEFERDPKYRPEGIAPLKPGTEYVRHYKGAVHRVRVTTHGYEYQGEIYESLSGVARKITGTQWSGPRFFEIRSTPKAIP